MQKRQAFLPDGFRFWFTSEFPFLVIVGVFEALGAEFWNVFFSTPEDEALLLVFSCGLDWFLVAVTLLEMFAGCLDWFTVFPDVDDWLELLEIKDKKNIGVESYS